MKRIVLFLLGSLTIVTVFSQNLITNGDFETGFAGWNNLAPTGTAVYSLSTADKQQGTQAFSVVVSSLGTNAWDIQTMGPSWTATVGQVYSVSFYAKSLNNGASITVLEQNTKYAAQSITLSTSWQKYEWLYTAGETVPQHKFQFPQIGTFLIDAVVIAPYVPPVQSPNDTISVTPSTSYQTMIGFGGALTWFCPRIVKSPKKAEIVNLLFNDLGADIIRFKNWYYPTNYPTDKTTTNIEGGIYWQEHLTATNELHALAKQANPNIQTLLCSWTPPSYLKSNAKQEEGTLKKNNNVFMYDEFATYWNDVLDNITFNPDYISIQNEPGFVTPDWGTCQWRPTETVDFPGYDKAFDAVYNKIKTRAYVPKLIGPEVENIGSTDWNSALNLYREFATPLKAKPYLSSYAFHPYNFSGSPFNLNKSLLNIVKNEFNDKPNFMTEFAGGSFKWLQTADAIQSMLVDANVSAYIFWQMMWVPNSDAMIEIDDLGNYTVGNQYYAIKHFAKYIDKDYKRIDVSNVNTKVKVTGFINPTKDQITLVMVNEASVAVTAKSTIAGYSIVSSQVYQSDGVTFFQNKGALASSGDVVLPDSSITTIVMNVKQLAYPSTPPSCVITAPFTNAYFQANSDVDINVYSSNLGGSSTATVSKVEFYNETTKIGQATTATNNTFSFTWTGVPVGTYTIKAVATNSNGVSFTSSGIIIQVGTAAVTPHGMSSCKGKYLANILGAQRTDYMTYWNGVTAENSCKWGSVEGTKDVMSWTGADASYNYAKNNNLMFRYHALAWGSQYPSWITTLTPTEFQAQMEQYMAAVAAKYPYIDQIDVLNEQIGTHAGGTPYFATGLGGTGTTGYDWQIWLFTKARQYFPNTKLVLNDYGLENDQNSIKTQLGLIKALRDRGLIDGFGTQAHCFNLDGMTATALKSSLDLMQTGGIPIYVTELDLNGKNNLTTADMVADPTKFQAEQLANYQAIFPTFWSHPAVAGISLWGYVEGSTWKVGTGILQSNGTERPAMTWLKSYISGLSNIGYPLCPQTICTTVAPTVTATKTYCQNTTATALTATGTALKWYTVSTGGTALALSPIPSTTATGTTIYYVSQTLNSCEGTRSSIAVTVNALPTVNAGSNVAICLGKSTTLTATGGTSYAWSNGIIMASNTVSPMITTTYNLTATNSNSCSATDAVVVTVNALPSANTGSNVAICLGKSTTLTATGGTSYTWSNGINVASNTVSPTITTTYSLTATNSNSCSATDAVVVTVNALPTANAGSNVAICLGKSTTLTATGGTSYAWSNGINVASNTVSPTITTTYNLTATNSNSCSATDAVVVTVNALPTITPYIQINTTGWNINSTLTINQGSTVTFGPWPTVANGWSWTGPNGFTSNLRAPVLSNIAPINQGVYTAIYTDANTCSATANYTISVLTQQSIPLVAGWNLISTNVNPVDSSIATIFSGLDVQEIKTMNSFWRKGQNIAFNCLKTISTGQGYFVNMNVADTLIIYGTPSVETQNFASLQSGWQLIGCPYQTSTAFSTIFNTTNSKIIKDFNGYWIPTGTTNSITSFIPGKGYFIKK